MLHTVHLLQLQEHLLWNGCSILTAELGHVDFDFAHCFAYSCAVTAPYMLNLEAVLLWQ